ncbi:MAG: hypothetical protein KatS3mg068_2686 [Candidatus Sericytochromatia bacterium]|nr:MAG: hypothetical protein KatS3mg068_2686 [Candidatus Sericytochromatia bacterium]
MSKLWLSMVKNIFLNIVVIIYNILANSGCHRDPSRSFFYKDIQYPVCARCTGVILGQVSSLFLLIIMYLFKINIILNIYTIIFVLFLMFPMGIDWFLQEFFNILSNNIKKINNWLLSWYK